MRRVLDRLFYNDDVVARLQSLGLERVQHLFPPHTNEDACFERTAPYVGETFGGYSISHVLGRFRAADLMTHSEAADLEKTGKRYPMDETTAVVRLILLIDATRITDRLPNPLTVDESIRDGEADRIDWLFKNLFVNAVTRMTPK